MKKAKALLAGSCLFVLAGCNTVEGAAEDIRGAGESIGDTLDRTGKTLTGQDQPKKIEATKAEKIE